MAVCDFKLMKNDENAIDCSFDPAEEINHKPELPVRTTQYVYKIRQYDIN